MENKRAYVESSSRPLVAYKIYTFWMLQFSLWRLDCTSSWAVEMWYLLVWVKKCYLSLFKPSELLDASEKLYSLLFCGCVTAAMYPFSCDINDFCTCLMLKNIGGRKWTQHAGKYWLVSHITCSFWKWWIWGERQASQFVKGFSDVCSVYLNGPRTGSSVH